MAALDTNVLIRFLTQDDAKQLAAAKALMRKCIAAGQQLFVPLSVALELEWVLRSNLGLSKPEVIQTLSDLLGAEELRFESDKAVEFALAFYRKGSADYADCIHVALALQAGEAPLWTFDRAASKVTGAQLLSS